MNDESVFRFTAGILIRGGARKMLEREKFEGLDIRWFEEKGLLESLFIVRGNTDHLKVIESIIHSYE